MAKEIVRQLKSPPINMNDDDIAKRMLSIPHPPSRIERLFMYGGRDLESTVFLSDKRSKHRKRLMNLFVPKGREKYRNKVLQQAGIDVNALEKAERQIKQSSDKLSKTKPIAKKHRPKF